MPDAELERRPGVELIKTGCWRASTGSWNPTPEDLAAAVEAQECPAVRKPVLKLGHSDPRFDGEPALGWFENLHLTDGGNTLAGDQVALPWLHSVQAAAYPSRSVEGNYNHTCSSGHKHKFVLTAVALLGVTPPAVKTIRNLNDLPAMLGVAASEPEVPEGAEHVQATIHAAEQAVHTGAMVALIPTAEDAARLAVDGGQPADELHVTLAYLGEAAALGARGQQDVIDGVSTAANGLSQFEADAFAISAFNPGNASDRETCLVLGLSGDIIDAVHSLVDEALREALWSVDYPPPHRPWHAHMTLQYTDDLTRIPALIDRLGSIRFDRIRVAMGDQVTDIPLIPPGENETVAASAGVVLDRLASIRARISALERVAASLPPGTDPAPVLPAAEPEQEINPEPNEEDFVSTELSGLRSRLGLPDDADLAAIEAKVDAIKADAEKAPEPSPEMVAASAAAVAEREELKTTVTKLEEQMTAISAELSAAKAAQAATVKASVFDAAVKDGKLKPADREQWEKDYDEAPGAITRVLASIAPGTAVPVMASGVAGGPEPVMAGANEFTDADYNRVFGITEEV